MKCWTSIGSLVPCVEHQVAQALFHINLFIYRVCFIFYFFNFKHNTEFKFIFYILNVNGAKNLKCFK